jgi:hypothetical protein
MVALVLTWKAYFTASHSGGGTVTPCSPLCTAAMLSALTAFKLSSILLAKPALLLALA